MLHSRVISVWRNETGVGIRKYSGFCRDESVKVVWTCPEKRQCKFSYKIVLLAISWQETRRKSQEEMIGKHKVRFGEDRQVSTRYTRSWFAYKETTVNISCKATWHQTDQINPFTVKFNFSWRKIYYHHI